MLNPFIGFFDGIKLGFVLMLAVASYALIM
jgi:hypothetical protein